MNPHEEKQFWNGSSVVNAKPISFPPLTAANAPPVDITSIKFSPAPNVQYYDGFGIPESVKPQLKGGVYADNTYLNKPVESDPSGGSLNEPGKKADAGKNLPWLFQTGFANALHEVSRVTTLGARKYTPNGWATVPDGVDRYMEAFARHASSLAKGEQFDDGPGGLGTYHISQAIWNLLAAFELQLRADKEKSVSQKNI